MFEITLTHDLGVLAVQHEGVLDGTMLDVGQGNATDKPPPKFIVAPAQAALEVGQGDDGGKPPPKFIVAPAQAVLEVGQGDADGKPPPKF